MTVVMTECICVNDWLLILGEMSLLLLLRLESLREGQEVVLFQLQSLYSPVVVNTERYEVVRLPLSSPEPSAQHSVLVLEVPIVMLGDVAMRAVNLHLDGV